MKRLFTALVISIAVQAGAASYHVSAAGQADASSARGTAVKPLPFSALAALGIAPGDSVLLRRGDVFRGSLTASSSGTPGRPIHYGAYGQGADPVIDGAEPIKGWKPFREGILVAECPHPVTQLFIDGAPMPLARHPDRGYILIDSVAGDGFLARITPPRAGRAISWIGATIHIKSERFSLDSRKLRAYDAARGILHPDRSTNYPVSRGKGFFLTGVLAALDAPGEWYCDTAGKRIYLRLPGVSHTDRSIISGSVRAHGFLARNVRHLSLAGIRFVRQAGSSIDMEGMSEVEIVDCTVENSGEEGMRLEGSALRVRRSAVTGAVTAGIQLQGSRGRVEANRIRETGHPGRLGDRGFGGGCCRGNGIEAYGDGNRLEGNRVEASALNGIRFEGAGNQILGNHIDSSCLHLDDGGGIYSWGAGYPEVKGPETLIRGNTILNSLGVAVANGKAGTSAHGIYLDHSVQDYSVTGNTVSNTDVGIYLHDTRGHAVMRNVLFGNREVQLLLKRDYSDPNPMTGNRIAANVMFALPGQQVKREEILGVTNPGPLATYFGNQECSEDSTGQVCVVDGKQVWRKAGGRGSRLALGASGATVVLSDSLAVFPDKRW